MHINKRKLDTIMAMLIMLGYKDWILIMLCEIYYSLKNSKESEHIQARMLILDILTEAGYNVEEYLKRKKNPDIKG